jgi:hypothetical protein
MEWGRREGEREGRREGRRDGEQTVFEEYSTGEHR